IRVPNNSICQALIAALDNPVVSTSALSAFSSDDRILSQAELFDHLDRLVDIIIDDGGDMSYKVSTVLDLTDEPTVVRKGLGWEAAASWVSDVT
ncbi:MAG TPA: Sua5/YciO/YrdC/YwlC family protein, partial [Candidatus Obscuribacterales bacterium]